MFIDNYIMQCNRIDKSPSAAAEEMGFHRSEVTRWKNGSVPRRSTLLKMAEYFDCSVEELTEEKIPAQTTSGLTKAQLELIRLIPLLTDEEFATAERMITALIRSR